MKKVFIDLEMNPTTGLTKDERTLLRQEIIEIGAVMYDEKDNRIATFREYVHPVYSGSIDAKVRKLTHITDEMVAGSDLFENVIDRFLNWCGQDCRLYCWSENDTAQLRKEALFKGYAGTERLLRSLLGWEDVQQITMPLQIRGTKCLAVRRID